MYLEFGSYNLEAKTIEKKTDIIIFFSGHKFLVNLAARSDFQLNENNGQLAPHL